MAASITETFDVTARKFHQAACVALVVIGFVLGGTIGPWLVALVGLILFAGRFWWPADVFRQLAWRALEPAGILKRREVQEDHETRRVARVIGGLVLLAGAALVAAGQAWAWVAIGAIAVMIAFDFCLLCAITHRVGRFAAGR